MIAKEKFGIREIYSHEAILNNIKELFRSFHG